MSDFVRNLWYVAGWSHDVGREPFACRVLGEPIVLFRVADGTLSALEDRCVHRLAPLSLGRIEGDQIRCMYHGLRFSADGRCTEIPGQDIIPPRASVRRYPVVERGSWIWVWMGEEARADPGTIPNSKALDDPEWVLATGQKDFRANYALINDNLLDLAHLAFVHANSFGADEAWSSIPARVEPIAGGVRTSRWIRNSAPTPPVGALANLASVDMWTSYDFMMPGIFLLYTAAFPAGSADSFGGGAPDGPGLFSHFTSQAVTPQTAETSRYFFSWGPRASQGDRALAELMLSVADRAFEEDRVIIEAQQRIIEADPGRVPMPTAADKGITLFRRMMQGVDGASAPPAAAAAG